MSEFIDQFPSPITRLRALTQVDILPYWHLSNGQTDLSTFTVSPILPLNEKGHLAWSKGREVLCLSQLLIIPPDLSGYPLTGLSLRLSLSWWADHAVIFVNGKQVHEGDLFDASVRVLLTPSVQPGEQFYVCLRLLSPVHDRGGLIRSILLYEHADSPLSDPGFLADELTILHQLGETIFAESSPQPSHHSSWREVMNLSVNLLDWENLTDRQKFEDSLLACRQSLSQGLAPFFVNHPALTSRKITCLGHAHLDLAWLWPIAETWEVAKSTFISVLGLQQDFPQLIFGHTTPVLYEWLEQHEPDLFQQIQNQVKQGNWELIGGLWVEPDLNLIDGESMIRQVLYGQLYIQEKFGQWMSIAWLPDTFGFTWQLPQILQKGGIDYFVTQKLRWNDTTPFPYPLFWWEAPNGSRVLSFMSAPIGEGIDPVKMTQYSNEWYEQTGWNNSLWLVGVGDHGGGPTRDMLEIAERWQKSPFFPPCEFNQVNDYLAQIPSTLLNQLPIWRNELYLQFHRGCYTTHAEQKRWNRQCEQLLRQAELFASLSTLLTQSPYPKWEIETAWKTILFNQFHDILPGSSIGEVYQEVNPTWENVFTQTGVILRQAIQQLSHHFPLPHPPHPNAQPIIIWNPLNWSRSQVVSLSLPNGVSQGYVCHSQGEILPSQISDLGDESPTLLFLASHIPSIGYRVFWWIPTEPDKRTENTQHTMSIPEKTVLWQNAIFGGLQTTLETDSLLVIVDGETGNLISVFDKLNQRETLGKKGGNLLQGFKDEGQYWDGWNIAPDYQDHPLPQPSLIDLRWIERGEVRQRLRVIRQLGQSVFRQDYILDIHSPYLTIETQVDWQETHVLAKAAFNWAFESDHVTSEIPCGVIERTTRPTTEAEKAQWEVPVLRWADHSDGEYGVSLLNDCKYGYDAQPDQLRLTLLRSSTWPDPQADRGIHHFRYAIHPHSGNWQTGETVKRGYEFNVPLLVEWGESTRLMSGLTRGEIDSASLLELSDDSLVVMALKLAEGDSQRWILRLYESQGKTVDLSLGGMAGLEIIGEVDLLERFVTHCPQLSPFSIATFTIDLWRN